MTWEIYKGECDKSMKKVYGPSVCIVKKGEISINSTLTKMIGNHRHAQLLFDASEQKIGIKLVSSDTQHAYQMRYSEKLNITSITASGFLERFGISHEKSRRFEIHYDEAKKIISFRIGEKS
ncbi:MAG: hypothetical protein ACYC27_14740 [Armatimonadota bacterium]